MLRREKLITAPSIEPVTIAEIRRQLRLDDSDGEPAPTAPTVALAGLGAGLLSDGIYRYKLTFVTADGETEGGTASSSVTVAAYGTNGQVAMTSIPLGGGAVTSRRIYRTAAGGSTYKLVATISDNTTTTYTDNIADASLGTDCPTTNTTEDPDLTRIRKSARLIAEGYTGRAFITQTWDYYLNRFPSGPMLLPWPKLQSVTHVKYYDTSGTLTTLEEDTDYSVITESVPGFIAPAYGCSWPNARGHYNDVVVRIVCGEGDASSDVDERIRNGILALCAHLYDNRELVSAVKLNDIPMNAKSWLDQIEGGTWEF